jgi:predicted ABC-type ATPase
MKLRKHALPRIVMIAGPNGAGKTTFAEEFLPREAECPDFINADLIAQGISPFAPARGAFAAGRIMQSQMAARLKVRTSFAFETTLSGLGYARQIPRWRDVGYHVKIVFLSIPTVDLALARIRARVAQGGHNVPEAVVRRRFRRGIRNFEQIYQSLVNSWVMYDNSGPVPKLVHGGDNP